MSLPMHTLYVYMYQDVIMETPEEREGVEIASLSLALRSEFPAGTGHQTYLTEKQREKGWKRSGPL